MEGVATLYTYGLPIHLTDHVVVVNTFFFDFTFLMSLLWIFVAFLPVY
jgi:hypothetical protein